MCSRQSELFMIRKLVRVWKLLKNKCLIDISVKDDSYLSTSIKCKLSINICPKRTTNEMCVSWGGSKLVEWDVK